MSDPQPEVKVPDLTAEEVDYYEWLMTGILDGAWRLAAQNPEIHGVRTIAQALDEARGLFDELMTRIKIEKGDPA